MNGSDEFHKDLIELCKKNNRDAQKEIYKLYSKSMYNTSLRIVKNSMTAEDVVQEAFIAAYTSIRQFKGEVPFAAWLRRIVINKSIDWLRRNRFTFYELQETNTPMEEYDREELYDYADKLERVKQEVLNLPDGYRMIFSMYYLEGYDHDEIGKILGISASTSRSQLTRAKKLLLKNLEKK